MIAGIQRVLLAMGKEGCYYLSLIYHAEAIKGKPWDVVGEFQDMVDRKMIGPDGFIIDASKVFSLLMDEKWECIKAGEGHPLPLNYVLKSGEREVLRYEYTDDKGVVHAHFVSGDGRGGVSFDPMGVSESVQHGKMVSRRILRRL